MKAERNAMIHARLKAGALGSQVAREFGISQVRVWHIAHRDGYGHLLSNNKLRLFTRKAKV